MKKTKDAEAENSEDKGFQPLSDLQKLRLTELEQTIEGHQKSYITVGESLAHICDEKLYKATHKSFDAYCDERWGFSGSHARRFMDAYKVAKTLQDNSIVEIDLPRNEYQARLLFDRRKENKWVPSWNKVLKAAKKAGSKVTSSLINAVVSPADSNTDSKPKSAKNDQDDRRVVEKALKLIEEAKKSCDQKAPADWKQFLEELEELLQH